jgi:hypothetical protein
MRDTMKMPAVTMVAAWISAEIGVGQPDVQRELRRLAHRADEQADAGSGQQRPAGGWHDHAHQLGFAREHFLVVHAAGRGQQQADAQDEAEVADTVDQEGLHVREDRRRAGVPEADQQVRHQAHRFPAEEQLQEVVGHDQHQHREGEQRDVREEAVVTVVLGHVADRVDVHHQRHRSHHAHHHRGQRVDLEADRHLQFADGHPGVDVAVVGGAAEHLVQRHDRDDHGDENAGDGGRGRDLAADHVAEELGAQQAGDRRARQRRQRHRQQEVRVNWPRHFL